jgi:hypothetical protein
MTAPDKPSISPNTSTNGIPSRMRIRSGLLVTLVGLFIYLLGARPALFGLDRSPVVGFVQISVFLVGLAVICIGGYICLMSFWKNGDRTIPSEIGSRLVATGYVVAVFCGMADVFGFGTQSPPMVPVFGPWQATGVQIGELLITIGFLLLIPIHWRRQSRKKQ